MRRGQHLVHRTGFVEGVKNRIAQISGKAVPDLGSVPYLALYFLTNSLMPGAAFGFVCTG